MIAPAVRDTPSVRLLRLLKTWLWDKDIRLGRTRTHLVLLAVLSAAAVVTELAFHHKVADVLDLLRARSMLILYNVQEVALGDVEAPITSWIIVAGVARIVFGVLVAIADLLFYKRITGKPFDWEGMVNVAAVNAMFLLTALLTFSNPAIAGLLRRYQDLVQRVPTLVDLHGALALVAAGLIGDFCYYWSHRLSHKIRFFWNLGHINHHRTENLSQLTQAVDPQSYLLDTAGGKVFVLILLPFITKLFSLDMRGSGWAFIVFIAIDAWTNPSHSVVLVYAEIRLRFLRVFRSVLVTPGVHYIHHSREQAHNISDGSNFGARFVFWDKLFGTYVEPPPYIPETGLYGDKVDYCRTPVRYVFAPYVKMLGELWHNKPRHWPAIVFGSTEYTPPGRKDAGLAAPQRRVTANLPASADEDLEDRKRATAVLYAGFFVFGLLSTVIGVALPNIKQEFHLSNQEAGLVFVCWSLGTLVGSYVGGKVFHPARIRALFSATAMIAVTSLLFLYDEHHPALFKLHVFIVALAGAVFLSVGHATAAHVSARQRASTLSFMDFCVSMGNLATPLLVNYLLSARGAADDAWRMVFVVSAVLLVGVAALALACDLRLSREHGAAAGAVGDHRAGRAIGYRAVATTPVFLVFMFASLFLHATEWGHSVWFVTYASEVVHLSPAEAREVFSLFLVGMACSRLLGGSLMRVVRPASLMAVLASLAAVAALSIPDHHSYYALRLLNFAFGFGLGALFPLFLGLSMDRAPGQAQLLSGIGLMAGTVGAKSMSFLMGMFADRSSLGETYGYVSTTMLALVGCVMMFLVLYSKRSIAQPALARSSPAGSEEAVARAEIAPARPGAALVQFEFATRPVALGAAELNLRGFREPHDLRAFLEGDDGRPPGPRPLAWDDVREHLWRRRLEAELKREYGRRFGDRKLIPPRTALKFLRTMWERYPLMRELYPAPEDLMRSSARDGQSTAA
jgi:sterol desaturase/sphingolipid hydroxylase (fatty acid hydroxylase superfamily)/fucose permease